MCPRKDCRKGILLTNICRQSSVKSDMVKLLYTLFSSSMSQQNVPHWVEVKCGPLMESLVCIIVDVVLVTWVYMRRKYAELFVDWETIWNRGTFLTVNFFTFYMIPKFFLFLSNNKKTKQRFVPFVIPSTSVCY